MSSVVVFGDMYECLNGVGVACMYGDVCGKCMSCVWCLVCMCGVCACVFKAV